MAQLRYSYNGSYRERITLPAHLHPMPMKEAMRLNFLDAWKKCGGSVDLTAYYLKSGRSSVQRWKKKWIDQPNPLFTMRTIAELREQRGKEL